MASLMLIHGLYPVALETRVQEALDSVRPYMESHGGNVELLGIEDGVARLRLEGSCNGCPASASTMELAIEQALQEAAPDLEGIDVEGVHARPAPALGGFELPMSGGGPPVSGWMPLEGLGSLMPGAVTGASAGGQGRSWSPTWPATCSPTATAARAAAARSTTATSAAARCTARRARAASSCRWRAAA